MLGFSLQKLLVLAAIIGAVWYGFKFMGRIDKQRGADAKASLKAGGGRRRAAPPDDGVEEMVRCETCGAFVAAASAASCGREDCPFRG
jgi:uncharacterized protein